MEKIMSYNEWDLWVDRKPDEWGSIKAKLVLREGLHAFKANVSIVYSSRLGRVVDNQDARWLWNCQPDTFRIIQDKLHNIASSSVQQCPTALT